MSTSTTETFEVRSSHGTFTVAAFSGQVISRELDGEPCPACGEGEDHQALTAITRFDVDEWRKYHNGMSLGPDSAASVDILDLGYWMVDGTYEPPAEDWRELMADMGRGLGAATEGVVQFGTGEERPL